MTTKDTDYRYVIGRSSWGMKYLAINIGGVFDTNREMGDALKWFGEKLIKDGTRVGKLPDES